MTVCENVDQVQFQLAVKYGFYWTDKTCIKLVPLMLVYVHNTRFIWDSSGSFRDETLEPVGGPTLLLHATVPPVAFRRKS
jgi:hypothetical protein